MYSPKVSEELVPVLYRLAKERRIPMTRLVDGIIRQSLSSYNPPAGRPERTSLPQGKLITCQPAVRVPESEPRKAVA